MADYLYEVMRDGLVLSAQATEVISAGWFVKSVSTVDTVKTAAGYNERDDIKVGACDTTNDDELVIGIALETVSSGSYLSVATKGMYIMRATEAIVSGARVSPSETTGEVQAVNDQEEEFHIGRCLIGSSDGATASYGLYLISTA